MPSATPRPASSFGRVRDCGPWCRLRMTPRATNGRTGVEAPSAGWPIPDSAASARAAGDAPAPEFVEGTLPEMILGGRRVRQVRGRGTRSRRDSAAAGTSCGRTSGNEPPSENPDVNPPEPSPDPELPPADPEPALALSPAELTAPSPDVQPLAQATVSSARPRLPTPRPPTPAPEASGCSHSFRLPQPTPSIGRAAITA